MLTARDAKATGLSVPSLSGCDKTAPIRQGDALQANYKYLVVSQWANAGLPIKSCLVSQKAFLHSGDQDHFTTTGCTIVDFDKKLPIIVQKHVNSLKFDGSGASTIA